MSLTIRQQMAKGSKWKVTKDFSAENHLAAKYVWRDLPNGPPYREHVQTVKKMTDFKAGETINILDKSSTYHPVDYSHGGVYIPLEIEGRGKGIFTLKDLQGNVELEEAVEQLIYVFHSPSLGYIVKIPYSSWDDKSKEEIKQADKTGGVLYSDKLTKAMKKKRSQDTKLFLLSHSGYYDGIDTSDIYYVFEPGGKTVEFPDDLEVQTIDKATKVVKETFKAKDYLDNAFRLRPLTLKYGSSIRSVFKDMEEKGKDFTTLLMFQDTNRDLYSDETSEKIKEFKDFFKSQKVTKSDYIMKSDYRTVAFAFKNRSQAMMIKLQCSIDLDSKLVDAETLADVKAA